MTHWHEVEYRGGFTRGLVVRVVHMKHMIFIQYWKHGQKLLLKTDLIRCHHRRIGPLGLGATNEKHTTYYGDGKSYMVFHGGDVLVFAYDKLTPPIVL